MYTRCFGEITSEASLHARQAVRGFQENLTIATAKHFPGHSTAPGDEHFFLTVNDDDEQTVRADYLPLFVRHQDGITGTLYQRPVSLFRFFQRLLGLFAFRYFLNQQVT